MLAPAATSAMPPAAATPAAMVAAASPLSLTGQLTETEFQSAAALFGGWWAAAHPDQPPWVMHSMQLPVTQQVRDNTLPHTLPSIQALVTTGDAGKALPGTFDFLEGLHLAATPGSCCPAIFWGGRLLQVDTFTARRYSQICGMFEYSAAPCQGFKHLCLP
jgi:hypothetical protein